MGVVKLSEGFLIATGPVLQPIADASNSAAAELGSGDDVGVFLSACQHVGSLQSGTDLDDFLFGHAITQEVTHACLIRNSSQYG